MKIKTVFDFNKAIEQGPYAWPGGYPCYFHTSDGAALSFDSILENADIIRDAIISNDVRSGWRVCGFDVNWEDNELICEHSWQKIQSAYGNDV